MRTFVIILVALLATSAASALDGEVYFSALNGNRLAAPSGGVAKAIAGVTIGHEFWRLRPWMSIETRMDENAGVYLHPSSVDYGVGIEAHIYDGIYGEVEHHCWHPVDAAGKVEEFNAITFKYKFGKEVQ